jgi:hypothetical protein
MKRVYFGEYGGTPVLHVNYSGVTDPDDLRDVVRKASALVQTHLPGSLLSPKAALTSALALSSV